MRGSHATMPPYQDIFQGEKEKEKSKTNQDRNKTYPKHKMTPPCNMMNDPMRGHKPRLHTQIPKSVGIVHLATLGCP